MMRKQETSIRILGLLLILDSIVLAFAPFTQWVSMGSPSGDWSPFFDRFGPHFISSPYEILQHRLLCVAVLCGIIMAMCFRRSAVSLTLALMSAFFVFAFLPHINDWVHPAGFAALVAFLVLSVSLFSLHLKASDSKKEPANKASEVTSEPAPGAASSSPQG